MDIGDWLRRIGFGQYEAAFCDNGIAEAVLPHLTVDDLKEIGVATVGDRRMLLAAIAALASPTYAEPTGPQPSPRRPTNLEVYAERRPITVMFCDLVGSTSLAATLDAEDWRSLVNAYLDEASAAVTNLGGHVLKRLGDGLMALFGYPKTQENDAERAVRAALAIQRALADLNARNAAKGAPELASAFLREAEGLGRFAEVGVASRGLAIICYGLGAFAEARIHCERALAACDPERDREARERFSEDTGLIAMSWLAVTMWQLGEVDRAREMVESVNRRAAELGHAPSMAHPLQAKFFIEFLRGDATAALAAAEALVVLGREHGMPHWRATAELYVVWARGRLHDPAAGATELEQALAALAEQGMRGGVWFSKALLAERELRAQRVDSALAGIDEALALARQAEGRSQLPFAHLLRGEILLKSDPANPAPAKEAFQTAIAIAQDQGARAFELRAALSLAKLYQSTGRPLDAHAVVSSAVEGFSPTPEMPEIAEAQTLLAALAETEEVKAEAARSAQRLQLRVAYANALIATRGYGAPETTEAFARARTAASDKDTSDRLSVDYGLWVGSYLRGELTSMRAHAAAFFSDIEPNPGVPEASVAHRAAGITHWFAGEYLGARSKLEQALALFQPGRDDDLAFRFGHDPGVGAMLYLAITVWPMGEISRALSLIECAAARIANVTHVGTRAYGAMHTAMFNLMRGDVARVASNAIELTRLANDHELALWRAFGVLLNGCLRAQRGDVAGGLEDMRRGSDLLGQQNAAIFDGLLKMALAQAEVEGGDPDRGLATLDSALQASNQIGHRSFDAELYRARGEILLRRDPANPDPAEEAFKTAIAVATQQGTRSFGLHAALALAKLCQSTDRPLEGHSVLAPALEGFSPTPEMPEIAEAQALLAALAETEVAKKAIAQRKRRLDLQTSYSQALMWGKGYAAEETRASIARIGEFAVPAVAARFVAYDAECLRCFTRGEYRRARETAETFLREAEAEGRGTEAGVARRMLGLILLHQGELKAARLVLERALSDYIPERDGETQVRFGRDTEVSASAYLALAEWHLGEVDRARRLSDRAIRRADELGHVAAVTNALFWKVVLESRRDDVATTRRVAASLLDLAEKYGIKTYADFGQLYAHWAHGRLLDPEAGANRLRQALADHVTAEGNKTGVKWYYGLLAELEIAIRGPDSALALIDEGLAIADTMGGHFMEPYLHRVRGDILLKRNTINPASAEESYKTAVVIAKRQGARSYELLASLALAKLYQTIGRPAEARVVLAPALEGFSLTSEMPQIAEALDLLQHLQAELGDERLG